MSRGPKLAIAIVLGLLAALSGMVYLQTERSRIQGGAEIVEVYVASDDIGANVPLDSSKVATRPVPRSYVQPQSITTAEVPDRKDLTGITIVPIREGEQILRTKLWEGRATPLVNDLTTRKGMVAVTVKIQDTPQAVHGLIQPRDRVDVLALLQFVKPSKDKFKEIRPLFYDVEVLAVNKTTPSSVARNIPEKRAELQREEEVAAVTLALPPVAAQQLILAQQAASARIWLVLRSPNSGTYRYETWNTDRLIVSEYRLWDGEMEPAADVVKAILGR